MWTMIASLDDIVAVLTPAFTQPSATTGAQLLLAWVMCLGKHRLWRVAATAHPNDLSNHAQRHALDIYYNFFERSAWTPLALSHRVGVLILNTLHCLGVLTLLIDDTLAH